MAASISREPQPRTLATQWSVAAGVALAAGALFGWLFREDILRWLFVPWARESKGRQYIADGSPYNWLPWWYAEITAVAGLLVALPLLVLAALSLLAPRFASVRTVVAPLFLCSSYLAVGAGSLAWALVARPQFVATERLRWGQNGFSMQWAYVSYELKQVLAFALAGQACVILVMVAKARWAVRRSI